jgi:hypothetical protein
VALLWMIVGMPFLILYQWPAMAGNYLWHEYISYERLLVTDLGVEIQRRSGSRLVPWHELSHVQDRLDPPVFGHTMILLDGSRIELHPLTKTDHLKEAAIARGVYHDRHA